MDRHKWTPFAARLGSCSLAAPSRPSVFPRCFFPPYRGQLLHPLAVSESCDGCVGESRGPRRRAANLLSLCAARHCRGPWRYIAGEAIWKSDRRRSSRTREGRVGALALAARERGGQEQGPSMGIKFWQSVVIESWRDRRRGRAPPRPACVRLAAGQDGIEAAAVGREGVGGGRNASSNDNALRLDGGVGEGAEGGIALDGDGVCRGDADEAAGGDGSEGAIGDAVQDGDGEKLAEARETEKGDRNAKIESGSWLKSRLRHAVTKIKTEPLQILTIPVSAAFVGWFTNKLAVEMIFHPLVWRGIPLRVVEGQPLGLIGWQGIVPAKAGVMSERMVDMVTSQLIDVEEVFRRLSPARIARLLGPEINVITEGICEDLLPGSMSWLPEGFAAGLPPQAVDELKGLRRSMLAGVTKDMQAQITKVLDLKEMVVTEMLRDRSLMVMLFQRCGKAEFDFLVNSGFFFGFLLGVLQMFFWLFYDKPWTLPAGGAIVGYATNWLAIKLIFEPVDPVKVGPFVLQGLFLKRQNEVAADFADFFSKNVLTSKKLWDALFDGSRAQDFQQLLTSRVVPFVSRASALVGANLDPLTVRGLAGRAAGRLRDHVHVLHDYTDKTLALRETMMLQMQRMSTRTFEGVLHPVFQEEEFTLIVAGAVLGAGAGFLQMLLSTKGVRKAAKKAATLGVTQAAKAADGVVEAGSEIVEGVAKKSGEAVAIAAGAARRGRWARWTRSTGRRCMYFIRRAPAMATPSFNSTLRVAAGAIAKRFRRYRRSGQVNKEAADTTSLASPELPPQATTPTEREATTQTLSSQDPSLPNESLSPSPAKPALPTPGTPPQNSQTESQ